MEDSPEAGVGEDGTSVIDNANGLDETDDVDARVLTCPSDCKHVAARLAESTSEVDDILKLFQLQTTTSYSTVKKEVLYGCNDVKNSK